MRPAADSEAQSLVAGILRAERRSVARAITEVENETAAGHAILRAIEPRLGRAHVVGVTGAPGAGKSTLVNALIGELGRRGRSVGVLAVDPSSPFSGGAILGDRIRMERHALAERVFIRSLASRGHLGGLSRAIAGAIDVLDAAGFERIVVETVGAGQSEVEIADLSDTRVVLCAPGFGDEIQALKAGILEIADVFVVSKSDLAGAHATELELRYLAGLRKGRAPAPRILRTSAIRGEGIAELTDAIEEQAAAGSRRRKTAAERMRRLIAQEAGDAVRERLCAMNSRAFDALCAAAARGELGREEAVAAAIRLVVDGGA